MYSNILVPIALDNEDDRIPDSIAVAKALAKDGAAITLLHVVESVPSYAMTYIPEDFMVATRKGIKSEMMRLAADHDVNSAVIDGHAGRSILDHAEEKGCDLIVIASHRPGMQTLLLGSTATHVVRHANCAVHVLR
ncbi:universal stress protein [Marivita sp.]|uniref:universal stress protein n=1 Tax=Marivita sp. TaxID=2003365 RepID=UPI0025BA8CFB|nr:universal stress protein [Marivita sp.]